MAGRPLSQARAAAELERIRQASETPSPRRDLPIDYTPDLPDEAVALAGIGMTFVEIADHWAISEETLREWEKAHQELASALQRARTRAKAWWTRQPRIAIGEKDNKFPAGAWSQQVRALFPEYDDKKGVAITLDIGSLVVVQRRTPTEPLTERAAGDAKPLIEGRTVRLSDGLTAEGSTESNLSDASDGGLHPPRGQGGGAGG